MSRPNSSIVRLLRPQRRRERQSVHVALSKNHRAYSVFKPASEDMFPLFKAIFILSDPAERSNSPLDTDVNLKAIFERLNDAQPSGEGKTVIDAFISEFEKERRIELEQPDPECETVSEESLLKAGIEFSTPAGTSFGISASHSGAVCREIRIQRRFADEYQGPNLRLLIWRHAQPLFRLILEELHGDDNFPIKPHKRGLLAIVTTRMVSTIGVSNSAKTTLSAGASIGDEAGTLRGVLGVRTSRSIKEEYKHHPGVSGLRFIVFPMECAEENKWLFYEGFSVRNPDISDDDDSFTDDTRNQNRFYRARKWVRGEGELLHSSDPTTVQRPHSVHTTMFTPSTDTPNMFNGFAQNKDDDANADQQNSRAYVDVSRTSFPVPWFEVDIRPFLNEFAQSQCRLASYYRRTASRDSQKLVHAVHLLRSALRKYCFESTVRALYDLSGCYLRGIGIALDFGMAKFIRYCAGGLRRNYDSRVGWLSRLALEVTSCPRVPIERTIASLTLYSRRTLTSPALERHAKAMCNLDKVMQLGKCGVARDVAEAMKLYRQAADAGDTDAMFNLAVILANGASGVASDVAEAMKLCRQAADAGDTDAMFNLAVILANGANGVASDAAEAMKLCRQAAHARHAGASYRLNAYSLAAPLLAEPSKCRTHGLMTFPDRVYQVPKEVQYQASFQSIALAGCLINHYFAHPTGVQWYDVTLGANPLYWLKENVFDRDPGEGLGADDPRILRTDAAVLGNRIILPYGVSQGYVMRSIAKRDLPAFIGSIAELDLPMRIAYGLSRKYSSAECESGVPGTIEYDTNLPDYEELFQGDTVWIAVTYSHDIFCRDGSTFTNQHLCQALRAVWSNGFAAGHTYVRLWCDQILRERTRGKGLLEWYEWYGTYPYAALPVVTALGPHSRAEFTSIVKSNIWLSLEERLGATSAGIDLAPGLGQDYILDLMATSSQRQEAIYNDMTAGVIWGHVPSAQDIVYGASSILLMYTGPIAGFWEKEKLALIKRALHTASKGAHHITGPETGDQEPSKTGDLVIDTLKNIDYNSKTNASNIPWRRQAHRLCYGGILDHLPAVRHIRNSETALCISETELYIALANKHYRVSNLGREGQLQRGLRNNNDLEVFVSLYHNSVVLYLVAGNPGHVLEIVNLKTIQRRVANIRSIAQDRTIPLVSQTEENIRRILIGAIIDFCDATTTSDTAKVLRTVQGKWPELESANGVKAWRGTVLSQ